MGNTIKNLLVWLALAVALMFAFNAVTEKKVDQQQIEYSQFIQQVNAGDVSSVNIEG